MYLITIAALVGAVSSLASATPVLLEQRQSTAPPYPYGIDPNKPFGLNAVSLDNSKTWSLGAYYSDIEAGTVALRATPIDQVGNTTTPSNFTLVGNHYGTQLSVYTLTSCATTGPCKQHLAAFGNNSPSPNSLLTFHKGKSTPSFGGLAFYGQYLGGDPEAGTNNLLSVAGAPGFTPFTVCQGSGFQVIYERGNSSSCQQVYIRTVPASTATVD